MAVSQKGWFSKELTWRMVLFNTLFHGLHIGLFVFGWWAQSSENSSFNADASIGGSKHLIND